MNKVTDCPKCDCRAYASNYFSVDENKKGRLYYCFMCEEYFTEELVFIEKTKIEAE